MERLARVIGPAPSEMSLEDLEQSIKREHSRVSKGLEAGAYSYGGRKKKAGRAPSKAAKIKKLEEKHGIPLEEIEKKLELLKKFEEEQEKIRNEDRKLACQQDENALRRKGK